MMDGTQTVAPMTRAPNAGEICHVNEGATAEALVVGLEAGVMVSGRVEAEACGAGLAYSPARSFTVVDRNGEPVIDCPGCQPGTNRYVIANWRDVLALIYGGRHHSGVLDCDSPVRRSLVANWGNLFEQACLGAPCPQGLRRAFRTGDVGQATDSFTSLVGLSTVALPRNVAGASPRPNPFCNAHRMGAIYGGEADYIDPPGIPGL